LHFACLYQAAEGLPTYSALGSGCRYSALERQIPDG